MKQERIKTFLTSHFMLITCILSGILSALYVLKGIREEFFVGTWIVIGLNLLYIPFAIIFRKKAFTYFYTAYSLILVFVLAFDKTLLFNNFSALFIICVVVLMKPKLELLAYILYLSAITVAFVLNEESLVYYFIHIVRSLWFIEIITTAIYYRTHREKLVLFEDEREILRQLSTGKIYQKEVEGFSENTIYRKLKAARERNGNLTRDQLLKEFKKEIEEEKYLRNAEELQNDSDPQLFKNQKLNL